MREGERERMSCRGKRERSKESCTYVASIYGSQREREREREGAWMNGPCKGKRLKQECNKLGIVTDC